jgi:hypothetical protein
MVTLKGSKNGFQTLAANSKVALLLTSKYKFILSKINFFNTLLIEKCLKELSDMSKRRELWRAASREVNFFYGCTEQLFTDSG